MKSNGMDIFEKLLGNSYRFLSYRPRSEKEVRDYLLRKSKSRPTRSRAKDLVGLNEEEQNQTILINSVIKKLKEQKFLDDREFVKWWIEQRSKVKPKSLKFIIFELKQKGITKDLIEEVLGSDDFETVSDYDKALKLAQKRIIRYRGETYKKTYEKMARFLASKGFDWEIIKKVIDQILPKGYNTNRQ